MRQTNKLSAVALKSLPPGKHEDGDGLRFVKTKTGAGKWVLRFMLNGKRREMGLGPWPSISLKDARDMKKEARQLVDKGIDPIAQREADILAAAEREAARRRDLLKDVAEDCYQSRKIELKNDDKYGRWFSPLKIHILEKLGNVPVAELDQVAVRDALQPIWHSKPVTANKAANRLRIVLSHAEALGLAVDARAVDKAKALLGAQRASPGHIPSMPWQDVPGYYSSLSNNVTDLALRLLILTAVRSAPIRFATPDEFDLEAGIWTVPAENMKGRAGKTKAFRVPLCDEAIAVVREAMQHGGAVLFPGRNGRPLSDMTMSKRMRTQGLEARPHGFRSSFRTWCEETGQPWEVAETALGHVIGGKVERAYQRSDLLERRSVLMQHWADHVTGNTGADVVALPGVRA